MHGLIRFFYHFSSWETSQELLITMEVECPGTHSGPPENSGSDGIEDRLKRVPKENSDASRPDEAVKEACTGTCAVCSQPGGSRCGGCWQVHYCGKEHQRQHWPRHKAGCKSYKVAVSPKLGRHLVATRPIPARTTILTSKPVVVGPPKKNVGCLGCCKDMTLMDPFLQCSSCGFPMCSAGCELKPWHAAECAAIRDRGIRQTAVSQWSKQWRSGLHLAIFTLRCLLLPKEQHQQVRLLQSHLKEIKSQSPPCILDVVVNLIWHKFGLLEFSREDISSMAAIAITNLTDGTDDSLSGYMCTALHCSDLTMIESSCVPNCVVRSKPKDPTKMIIVAARDISPQEHISISYLCLEYGNYTRHQQTTEQWFFSCECIRCMDPTELGLFMNSICCSKCLDSKKMSMLVCSNPSNIETAPWKCEQCSHTISSAEFKRHHTILLSKHSSVIDDLEGHETFLKENLWPKGLLHPTHEFVIHSKTKIAAHMEPEDCTKYVGVISDLEHFWRKIHPSVYTAHGYHMYIVLSELLKMEADFAEQKLKSDMLKMKLLYIEEELQKPLCCIMSHTDIENHDMFNRIIEKLISSLKLKCV